MLPNARVAWNRATAWPAPPAAWCWRLLREGTGELIGQGEAGSEAAAHAAAPEALGIHVDLEGTAPATLDAEPGAEHWDLGFFHGPRKQPWMVGPEQAQLCGIALSRDAADGLVVAASILGGVIEGAVDELEKAI